MTILAEASAAGALWLAVLLIPVIVLAVVILIWVLIIRLICQYMARKNAEAFDYDYLAERIAEETCKRMLLIERQKTQDQKVADGELHDQANQNCMEQPLQMENVEE